MDNKRGNKHERGYDSVGNAYGNGKKYLRVHELRFAFSISLDPEATSSIE